MYTHTHDALANYACTSEAARTASDASERRDDAGWEDAHDAHAHLYVYVCSFVSDGSVPPSSSSSVQCSCVGSLEGMRLVACHMPHTGEQNIIVWACSHATTASGAAPLEFVRGAFVKCLTCSRASSRENAREWWRGGKICNHVVHDHTSTGTCVLLLSDAAASGNATQRRRHAVKLSCL